MCVKVVKWNINPLSLGDDVGIGAQGCQCDGMRQATIVGGELGGEAAFVRNQCNGVAGFMIGSN